MNGGTTFVAVLRGGTTRRRAPPRAALNAKRPQNDGLNAASKPYHRAIGSWRCMKNCGACCYLEPSEREGLEDFLSPQELKLFYSMVGEDGWCIHFRHESKTCGIFETRPHFCRVSKERISRVVDIRKPQDFENAAIDLCLDHIYGLYGPRSQTLAKYADLVGVDLQDAEAEGDDVVDDVDLLDFDDDDEIHTDEEECGHGTL